MISRALCLWMLTELLVFGAIGHGRLGFSWCGALVFAVGVMLAVRAAINLATWALAWRWRTPAPLLGWPRTLAMVLREYLAFLGFFMVTQPFVRLVMPPDRLRPAARPLLLVHGYMCNRGCWWWLRRRLEAAGHTVATLSLEPPWGDIDEFAEQLRERVEAVCAATGAAQVTLVAHSMGGLVSRAYLAKYGAARIGGLITIATPHQGSAMARLGLGTNARQMRPGLDWLTRQAGYAMAVPFVSIRTPQDNFVVPQDQQRHPAALDETLPGVGHMAALCDAGTLELVRKHAQRMAA